LPSHLKGNGCWRGFATSLNIEYRPGRREKALGSNLYIADAIKKSAVILEERNIDHVR
jgi:hypothetical protein